MVLPIRDRFMAKVIQDDDCWTWRAAHFQATGYALFTMKGADGAWRPTVAHRIAYELFKGPIPNGLHIDHLCRNRGCVNPDHLEAVPPRVNTARGNAPAAIVVRTNICIRGHEFTPENTIARYRKDGRLKRECRECVRASDRARNKTEARRAHYRAAYRRRKAAST